MPDIDCVLGAAYRLAGSRLRCWFCMHEFASSKRFTHLGVDLAGGATGIALGLYTGFLQPSPAGAGDPSGLMGPTEQDGNHKNHQVSDSHHTCNNLASLLTGLMRKAPAVCLQPDMIFML